MVQNDVEVAVTIVPAVAAVGPVNPCAGPFAPPHASRPDGRARHACRHLRDTPILSQQEVVTVEYDVI